MGVSTSERLCQLPHSWPHAVSSSMSVSLLGLTSSNRGAPSAPGFPSTGPKAGWQLFSDCMDEGRSPIPLWNSSQWHENTRRDKSTGFGDRPWWVKPQPGRSMAV